MHEKQSSGDFSDISKFVCIRVTSDNTTNTAPEKEMNVEKDDFKPSEANEGDQKDKDEEETNKPTATTDNNIDCENVAGESSVCSIADKRDEIKEVQADLMKKEELVEPHKFAPKVISLF